MEGRKGRQEGDKKGASRGGREERREGGREGRKEGGREGGREGGMDGRKRGKGGSNWKETYGRGYRAMMHRAMFRATYHDTHSLLDVHKPVNFHSCAICVYMCMNNHVHRARLENT